MPPAYADDESWVTDSDERSGSEYEDEEEDSDLDEQYRRAQEIDPYGVTQMPQLPVPATLVNPPDPVDNILGLAPVPFILRQI